MSSFAVGTLLTVSRQYVLVKKMMRSRILLKLSGCTEWRSAYDHLITPFLDRMRIWRVVPLPMPCAVSLFF
jgi:hypothetical protein